MLRRVAQGRDQPTPNLDAAPVGSSEDAERFEIRRRLGAGGFGTVYEAFDRKSNARVALKTLEHRDGSSIYRFKQEFRTLAELTHPNLVQLYELHATEERWFFTMELVHGQDAHAYVQAIPRDRSPPQRSSAGSLGSTLAAPLDPTEAMSEAPSSVPPPGGPRADRPFDEAKLRSVFRQLAGALCFLHAAGRLHRDIKPPNVMVAHDGRVVLLDFGLVIDLASEGDHSVGTTVGTPRYMAPEQLGGDTIGPAADWYAVGVMLYKALTGRLPFEGSGVDLLGKKLTMDPRPPDEWVAGLPEDLSRLCLDLLQRAPAARPSGKEVMERLGRHQDRTPIEDARKGEPAPVAGDGAKPGTPFIGRAAQLQQLRAAFDAARAGRTAAALVHGRSGMGKSALLARFFDDLRAAEPGITILGGRCFEQESVPYKALDGLVDALGRRLHTMPEAEVRAILPRDIATLTRLFPALGRVPAAASAPRRADSADQLTLRRRAFAALRELFARLGDRGPLALFIDDLQWGDADSAALLSDLLRPLDAPVMLVVLAYRSDEDERSECLRAFLPALREAARAGLELSEIAVEELDEKEARDLARTELASGASGSALEDRAAAIARESGGWPFFIRELCRFSGELADAPPSLEAMLWARAAALPDGARRLLELIAVAGQPIDRGAAVRAAELGDTGPPVLELLRKNKLVRVRGDRSRDEIEPYHDRIRETVVGRLAAGSKKAHHLALAMALLAAERADDETLAVHFQAAGEAAKAAHHAVKAADQAMDALGFARAARLYRQAIALSGASDARRRELHEKLGVALGNAGRGPEAAAAYLIAVDGASAEQAVELQRRATEHYLTSGHLDEGAAALRVVLAATRLSIPTTKLGMLLRLLALLVFLRLRGLRFRERAAHEIPAQDLVRIDICAAVSTSPLMIGNPLAARYFQKRFLQLALRAGEPHRLLRALLVQVSYAALADREVPSRSAERNEQALLSLIERLRDSGPRIAALQGGIDLVGGMVAMFRGRLRAAREHFERVVAWFEANGVPLANEVTLSSNYLLLVLFYLGEWREMARRHAAFLEEARARGDRFLEVELTKKSYLLALMEDRPDVAVATVDHVEALLSRASAPQSFTRLMGRVVTALYRDAGGGGEAQRLMKQGWSSLIRSGMIFHPPAEMETLYLRGRAHLAAAAAAPQRAALLRAVDRDVRALGRMGSKGATACSACLGAAAAAGRGDRDRAGELLAAAVAGFEDADMALHAAACRRRLGELTGGDEGRALVASADAQMSAQQIRNPARMTTIFLPGAW